MPKWKTKLEERSLEFLYPDIAKEWHPTKNLISAGNVIPDTLKPFWWICQKGHEWEAPVKKRVQGSGCPKCPQQPRKILKTLQSENPKLSHEWHPTKNKPLTPDQVTPNSSKKVWWKCPEGHEWEAPIANRNRGSGCPLCRIKKIKENCLENIYPKLAQEWHPTRNENLTPKDISPKSIKKVWWKCRNGHEWKEPIVNRLKKKTRCHLCRLSLPPLESCLLTTHPELAKEWDLEKNRRATPKSVTFESLNVVWWKCGKGHSWRSIISLRANGLGCPLCKK